MTEQDYAIDSDENSDYMYDLIADVLKKIGPRGSCTKEEREASILLTEKLKPFCDSVTIEKFETYPQLGLISWTKRAAFLILLSISIFIIPFFLRNTIISLILSLISIGICLLNLVHVAFEYLFCRQWSPKLFPYKPKTSQNVVGVIKPLKQVKKRVIIGAHYDSAQRFNHLQYFREGYAFFLVGSIATLFTFLIIFVFQLIFSIIGFEILFIISLLNITFSFLPILLATVILGLTIVSAKLLNPEQQKKIIYGAFTRVTPQTTILLSSLILYYLIIDVIIGLFFIDSSLFKTLVLLLLNSIPYFYGLIFWLDKKAVPGACDNLTAVAICCCIAKILNDWKNTNKFPKDTEVVIALFGCEEIGSKGAEAFGLSHKAVYNKIDSTCICLDTIEDAETIKIFTRENSTRTDYDPKIYNLLDESAKELKINHAVEQQPGITGGTDGSGVVRGGLRASAMVALKFGDYFYYYHSDRDNLSMINKKRKPRDDFGTGINDKNVRVAMENALRILMLYLEKKDKESK
ncbi:MAG: M28 family peptidase [Candidatus Lokiarchaeota archaeon]|nr:M28 family peptidase [Candidatus Lokiarchaeota archaeon]